jgi:branched-chain amino acid transport system ATP-binding protein
VIVNTLYEIIPTLAQRGIGLLIVEQDISRSLAVADRFYCLLEGSVTLTGRPAEVPRETVTRHYFGL